MGERGDRVASGFLLVSLWVSATLIVGVVAWSAVARLGREGATSTQSPLSQAEVRRELARAPAGPSTGPRSPTTSNSTSPRPGQQACHFASWTVAGGRVGASCRRNVISISFASPADGWGMRVDDSGPDKVSVEFSRGDNDIKVEAACSKGIPTTTSDSSGD